MPQYYFDIETVPLEQYRSDAGASFDPSKAKIISIQYQKLDGAGAQLIVIDALVKTRNESIGNSGETERAQKVKGLYKCNSSMVNNKKVLLVDDVSTTGNTLNKCAKALVNSGVKEVRAFVCGINHRD